MHATHTATDRAGHEVVSPVRRLVGVWALLLALTAITVITSRMDFGGWEVAVALVIASVKAGIVAVEFMHLRHDRPMVIGFLAGAVIFLVLLVALTLLDFGAL